MVDFIKKPGDCKWQGHPESTGAQLMDLLCLGRPDSRTLPTGHWLRLRSDSFCNKRDTVHLLLELSAFCYGKAQASSWKEHGSISLWDLLEYVFSLLNLHTKVLDYLPMPYLYLWPSELTIVRDQIYLLETIWAADFIWYIMQLTGCSYLD